MKDDSLLLWEEWILIHQIVVISDDPFFGTFHHSWHDVSEVDPAKISFKPYNILYSLLVICTQKNL